MLDKLITSKTRRKLLTIFLTNPGSKFYLRELSRKTNEQVNAVRKELNKLCDMGLLKTEKIANLHYYCVNREFALFNELRNIIIKTDPISSLISMALQNIKGELKANLTSVILFGSVARNEIREDSDIDFIVICKELPKGWRERDHIAIELEKTGFGFGRAVHIELLTENEFEFSVKEGAPLLFEVIANNKITYDNGFFKKQAAIFKGNIERWNARKTDKFTWEVPELAIKV